MSTPTLICERFQSKFFVEFGEVKVGDLITKKFRLENPNPNLPISVSTSTNRNFESSGFAINFPSLLAGNVEILPGGIVEGEISWWPKSDLKVFETVYFKVDNKVDSKFTLSMALLGTANVCTCIFFITYRLIFRFD